MRTSDTSMEAPRAWRSASARWRAGDQALMEMAVSAQLLVLQRRVAESDWSQLLELLDSVHATHPLCALAIAGRLGALMQHLDARGLRRWILTGLRLHPEDASSKANRYFELQSNEALQSLHAEAGGVAVDALLPSLGCLLHMLAREALAVQVRHATSLHAAPMRPVIDAEHGLFLPDDHCGLDADAHWRLARASVAHAAAHWRFSASRQSGRGLKPMGHVVVGALEDARVEWLLMQEYPGIRRWFLAQCPRDVRGSDFSDLMARLHVVLLDDRAADAHGWIVKARCMFHALRQSGDLDRPEPLREAASILANDLGQMRLRMNLQAFHVPAPYRDDNSFLWDLGENANDPPPEMQAQVQSRSQPARLLQAQEDQAASAAQTAFTSAELPYFYPEWDYKLDAARADWCTLYERTPLLVRPAQRTVMGAAQAARSWRTAVCTDRMLRLKRQLQGDELDLDAAVGWCIDRRARREPSLRVFRDVGRSVPLLSVLVLVDLSQSCMDPLAGHSPLTLLDVQKQALEMLCRRVDFRSVRLAIHGFNSDTRNAIAYYRMLEFGQPPDESFIQSLNSLRAEHSTRLGAALRHAGAQVAQERQTRRAIILVGDGEPSDIDVFDARYLTEDARRAVWEVRRNAVAVAALGVGQTEPAQLRSIYGNRWCAHVGDPRHLAQRLSMLIARLSR